MSEEAEARIREIQAAIDREVETGSELKKQLLASDERLIRLHFDLERALGLSLRHGRLIPDKKS